jgi:hypothetical protein
MLGISIFLRFALSCGLLYSFIFVRVPCALACSHYFQGHRERIAVILAIKMGDNSPETEQQSESRQKDEEYRDQYFSYAFLSLDSTSWISRHIDCFVSQSRGNRSVKEVCFYPYIFTGHDNEFWDKVGQAIGNLQELKTIYISCARKNDDGTDVSIPDWGELARILSHVRQKIRITLTGLDPWAVGEMQALAMAIRGHPTITSFGGCYNFPYFPYECLDSLYTALAALPALESITLTNRERRPEDEYALANSESLTELLRLPALRSVHFRHFSFTPALCQGTANALTEGTVITDIKFSECTFSAGECASILANGFSRNASVLSIIVQCDENVSALLDALAATLPVNSTLQDLSFTSDDDNDDDDDDVYVDWSPVFSDLGKNAGLKTLKVDGPYSMDQSLCTAMQNGIGMNETLESMELNHVPLCDDNADFWCRAFSFIRTNKALKSLTIRVKHVMEQPCSSAFRIHIATMLQDNTSLESLSIIRSWCGTDIINAEEYIVLVTMLQHNMTLRSLNLRGSFTLTTLTHDEDKQMAMLLKKNYALESLPGIDLKSEARDVGAVLRLNEAGRRYLIEDGFSVSKGVEVLSAVSNEINCIFLHLLENPTLCDRSAVETAASYSDSTDTDGSTSTVNTIGKREHGRAQNEVKESRRRLT